MTDDRQQLPFQGPGRADYARAATLMINAYRYDTAGFNSVMLEVCQLGRVAALVLAIIEIAGRTDPLNTPEGLASLANVAWGMELDDMAPDE